MERVSIKSLIAPHGRMYVRAMRERMEEVTDRLQRTSEDLDSTVRLTRVDVFHFYSAPKNCSSVLDVFIVLHISQELERYKICN